MIFLQTFFVQNIFWNFFLNFFWIFFLNFFSLKFVFNFFKIVLKFCFKYNFKTAPLKAKFQKLHFQNCFLKKYIFKIANSKKCISKNIFSKWLSQKIHFENCSLKKYVYKKLFLKIVPCKNVLLFNIAFSNNKKIHFQNTFSKLLA